MTDMDKEEKGYSLEVSGERSFLTITGTLSAERAETLQAHILTAISDASEVVLSVESFRDTDMAIVQLLSSSNQSALVMKKKIYLEGEGMNEFLALAESVGFSHELLCSCREGEESGNSRHQNKDVR